MKRSTLTANAPSSTWETGERRPTTEMLCWLSSHPVRIGGCTLDADAPMDAMDSLQRGDTPCWFGAAAHSAHSGLDNLALNSQRKSWNPVQARLLTAPTVPTTRHIYILRIHAGVQV